ncbi:MAG: dihydroorotate dehydrogenase [bacterium]|nr:dihydroorotate dehydrogenase [bacterium]
MDFKTNLAGIPLEHPLMNAAGTCKLIEGPEGVKELARSAAAAIMVGSITLEPRAGNEGDIYYSEEHFSLNSLGLPNPGKLYYKKYLPEMAAIAYDFGKPLFVSVAGFNPHEYAVLAGLAINSGADLVELNLSCPNVWDNGSQKRIACFDLSLIQEILFQVIERVGLEAKLAIKISPFSDPFLFNELAKLIHCQNLIYGLNVVKVITAVNTFPNAISFNKGKPVITIGDGLAGLAGPALKPIALGQIRQLRGVLPESIDIIGVGGIACGQDVLEYLLVGANAVQIGTSFLSRGAKVFSEILAELV